MFCRPTGRFSFEWGWFSSAVFSGIHPHTIPAPEEQKKETQPSVRARGGLLLESSLFFQTTGESTERESRLHGRNQTLQHASSTEQLLGLAPRRGRFTGGLLPAMLPRARQIHGPVDENEGNGKAKYAPLIRALLVCKEQEKKKKGFMGGFFPFQSMWLLREAWKVKWVEPQQIYRSS